MDGVEWGKKHITFYSVIKESKFYFLYEGGSQPIHPFHPSTNQQSIQSIKNIDWFHFIVEFVWLDFICELFLN